MTQAAAPTHVPCGTFSLCSIDADPKNTAALGSGGWRTHILSVQGLSRIPPSMEPLSRLEPKWPCFHASETQTL